MIRITISIVLYNPMFEDLDCLFSSMRSSIDLLGQKLEAHVSLDLVDNNILAGYRNRVENLAGQYHLDYKYIVSDKNGGYGYGNNLSIKQSKSDFHLICNPDIEFYEDTLLVAVRKMLSNDSIALLVPAVFGRDGQRQYLCKRNPKLLHFLLRGFAPNAIKQFFSGYLRRFEYRDFSYDQEIKSIPFCSGCFMFYRRQILTIINGFDEGFFYYNEDADLTRRTLPHGEVLYYPELKVIHRWDRGAHKNWRLKYAAIKTSFQYFKKWGGVLRNLL